MIPRKLTAEKLKIKDIHILALEDNDYEVSIRGVLTYLSDTGEEHELGEKFSFKLSDDVPQERTKLLALFQALEQKMRNKIGLG